MRILLAVLALAATTLPGRAQLPHIVLRTALGEIEMQIDSVHAPATAANFLRYIDAGFYAKSRFHRTRGFAAFGRVVRRADVVRKIQQAPAQARRLTPAVGIIEITRVP